MKKLYALVFTLFSLCFPRVSFAQVPSDSVAINALSLGITNEGALIPMLARAQHKMLLFNSGLWLSATDSTGALCGSFQDYLGSSIHFTPGPISTNPSAAGIYGRVWKMNKTMIDSFTNGFYGTAIPQQILNWPALGNPTFGESFYLAPFVDANADGYYSPTLGDYPCIMGDQAIFFMMNDVTANPQRKALPMGIEVMGMAYAYAKNTFLDSAIFVNYTIRFKQKNLKDFTIAQYADFDIGNSLDDIVGTFVDQNTVLTYNADSLDEGPLGYGQSPPAAGLTILNGLKVDYYDGLDNDKDGCVDGVRDVNGFCQPIVPGGTPFEYSKLLNSMAYNNQPSVVTGNPQTAIEYVNYMKSQWRNGLPLRIENPCGFMNPLNGDGFSTDTLLPPTGCIFPGNSYDTSRAFEPSAPTNWFASPAQLNDQRLVANMGTLDTILIGQEQQIRIALFMARDLNSINSYNAAYAMAKKINGFVDTVPACSGSRLISIAEEEPLKTFSIYPNPAQDEVTIAAPKQPNTKGEVVGVDGRILLTFQTDQSCHAAVAVGNLPNGVYVIRIGEKTERLLIQR
jgi:hypothetical protein